MLSIFAEIEKKYNWKLKAVPIPLSGGFLHKMYRLETDHGNFALKLLNPHIMQRQTAKQNYANAERLEELLTRREIPVLPAMILNGQKMQEIDGQYFYLYPFYPGKALRPGEITEYHCEAIGKILANIHNIHRRQGERDSGEMSIDWEYYLAELEKSNKCLYEMLKAAIPAIRESQSRGNAAGKQLPGELAICHNDMDPKNVLWNGADYRIIDLECLSYGNPYTELLELALSWSGFAQCRMEFRLFWAFLRGYGNAGGALSADWESLYDGNNGRLEWLEYNLKRALGIDCGPDEIELGIAQSKETIAQITYAAQMRRQILSALADL